MRANILFEEIPDEVLHSPADDDIPSSDTLADITRQIYRRPLWLAETPFEVDLQTYQRARDEMIAIQRARGFPLATADIKRQNFLLRGIPVVIGSDT